MTEEEEAAAVKLGRELQRARDAAFLEELAASYQAASREKGRGWSDAGNWIAVAAEALRKQPLVAPQYREVRP